MLFNTFNPGKFAFSKENEELSRINNNSSFEDSKIWGIIGVPFDSTCSYHHGSRFAPMIIREASFGFEQYNSYFDKVLDAEFYDCGDLNIVHGNCFKTCNILEDAVLELIDANIKPIVIGGEHSITKGSINALINKENNNDLSDITVIHLDAHRDIINEYIGEKDSHATIMRRVYDLNPKQLIQIGIRSFSVEEKDFVSGKNNIHSFLAKDIKNTQYCNFNKMLDFLNSIEGKVYLSIDMDVFDPSFAPSVGNPTPGGLSPNDIELIFKTLSNNQNINIIGFDIVEVATSQLGDITAVLASKIIYDFLTLFG